MYDDSANWIMSIIALCNSAIATGRTVARLSEAMLNKRQKDLLIAASHDGIFQVVYGDRYGKYVFTNSKVFASSDDPAETAHNLDAFIKLCAEGLVEHQDGEMFRLTGQGFDIARKLARSIQ